MKTLGLIGGMSWESTDLYYQGLNREIYKRKGGLYSAPLILESVDFNEIAPFMKTGEWDVIAEKICTVAKRLEAAGVDAVALTTNTVHKIADDIQDTISVPFITIFDSTADAIKPSKTAGLLGTLYTMSDGFYQKQMTAHSIDIVVPKEAAQKKLNALIFDEFCQGKFTEDAKAYLEELADDLIGQGAEKIILGCTELPISLEAETYKGCEVIDTALVHVKALTDFITGE